jgi:competence protein ComEA
LRPAQRPGGLGRAIEDRVGLGWWLVPAAFVVAAAALVAFAILGWLDRNSGPAIIIEDPRADATIVVAVAGAVATPGVYGFPDGARVDDALTRAGGVLPEADLAGLNPARRLDDGEELVVARVPPTPTPGPAGQPPPQPTATVAATTGPAAAGALVNVNTASVDELETLPEIGEARAEAIVAYREANGPFETVDELVNVDGISERIVELIRPFVTVGP